MIEIKITDVIKEACPKMRLGCIQAKVNVGESSENLLNELNNYSDKIMDEMAIEDIASLEKIHDCREVYKKLGKAPSKYRVSSEALLRRILHKKGLYKINNIVEINNFISIKSHFSVGSYDVDKIKSPVCLTVAKKGDTYKGIGKDFLNMENLPVLCDEISIFGSPTSDSQRAMITDETKEIIMCIYSFSGDKELYRYLNEAQELLEKYADGSDFEINIIR